MKPITDTHEMMKIASKINELETQIERIEDLLDTAKEDFTVGCRAVLPVKSFHSNDLIKEVLRIEQFITQLELDKLRSRLDSQFSKTS